MFKKNFANVFKMNINILFKDFTFFKEERAVHIKVVRYLFYNF